MQSLKPNAPREEKDRYSTLTEPLKNEIINKFNQDYSQGLIIDSDWLKRVINKYHNRPQGKNDYTKHLIPFIEKFAEDSAYRMNSKTGKQISERTIQKYRTVARQLEEFESVQGKRLTLSDIGLQFHKEFTTYLKLKMKYSNTLIEKTISTIKGFIKEAKSKDYKVCNEAFHKDFTFSKDEVLDVYLNESEIDLLFSLDLSQNERLDNVRDLFIVGLRTGLRISDLKRINQFLFSEDSISITETEKTGSSVKIPIHSQVKAVLEKRSGRLPKIISEQKFNDYVKELCQKAGITEMVLGNIKNKVTNRKEKGYYPKYKLVSSHICRRSFATNLYGQLTNKTIMAITTHKSEAQFEKYIKTTSEEHYEKIKNHWAKMDDIKKANTVLRANYN
jgi:site-specific recombinase XerC